MISLILFLFFVQIQAQNFIYSSEDWYIIKKPGSINAIAEDDFYLYFATESGIYKYNKGTEDYQFDSSFSIQLNAKDITHFYYDEYRGYFWIVHSQGINFKSLVFPVR